MTVPLERIRDGSPASRNFDKLANLVIDTGGRSIGLRFGTATLSFAASTNAGPVTVTHGLGKTPTIVLANSHDSPAFGNIPTCDPGNIGDTTFDLSGEVKSAFTGDVEIFWVVIG